MTDPDLTERVAAEYVNVMCGYDSPANWELMEPEDRAYWRGVVATIADLLGKDRRPVRVGTLTPAQLADLDPHDTQAMEAVEQ